MPHLSHVPASPLSSFVERMWFFGDAPSHARRNVVPSGVAKLVVNLDEDEIRVYDPDRPGECRRHSGAVVSGLHRRPYSIDTRAHASIVSVHFAPAGAFAFFGPPARELADRHVDLRALWGPFAAELRERLCEAPTWDARVRILEQALLAHLVRPDGARPAVRRAADLLGAPGLSVAAVARRVETSHRHLIDAFTSEVGVAPKLYARVLRFRRALARARATPRPDWADLAHGCGYADQSHLVREFAVFAGVRPGRFAALRVEREREGDVECSPDCHLVAAR